MCTEVHTVYIMQYTSSVVNILHDDMPHAGSPHDAVSVYVIICKHKRYVSLFYIYCRDVVIIVTYDMLWQSSIWHSLFYVVT